MEAGPELITLTPPLGVPAGTMAAFARIMPEPSFMVETAGCAPPLGQIVTNAMPPAVLGITVMLNE
jgi:hypothetical protein